MLFQHMRREVCKASALRVLLSRSSTRVLTSFVKKFLPGHHFTTVVLFHNTKTDLHVDSRNFHSPNGVIPVSPFKNGGIWIADGCGPHPRTVNGSTLQGTILDVASGPVVFDAFKYPHQTESWQGDRLVCVAFTVSSLAKLSLDSARLLLDLGFNPPPRLPFPIAVAAKDASPLRPDLWVYELFSGSARFSRSCRELGFKVLGFDSSSRKKSFGISLLHVSLFMCMLRRRVGLHPAKETRVPAHPAACGTQHTRKCPGLAVAASAFTLEGQTPVP